VASYCLPLGDSTLKTDFFRRVWPVINGSGLAGCIERCL
jgi:hypothetical protein